MRYATRQLGNSTATAEYAIIWGKALANDLFTKEEENRLLYDDANGMQYGSFGDQAINGENDTLESQRENEALQRVIAKTSEYVREDRGFRKMLTQVDSNMVDIFDIAPQENVARGTTTPFAYAGQGARLARYQHLVSKLSSQGDSNPVNGVKVDWLPEDETIEMRKNGPASIKTVESDDGPLVGTFADAAAAMQ
ncbi:hypothetical protein FHETE_4579 [Fusarium heterosporum]|uniref:Uncharacterized protein n=1 Tax=Fusarium heterosporum TaxID=42747 RepID=A0A8H5TKN7_FUSHE|nr:hypothetical protein FHETE_4579 [Fusarium heterosporum]